MSPATHSQTYPVLDPFWLATHLILPSPLFLPSFFCVFFSISALPVGEKKKKKKGKEKKERKKRGRKKRKGKKKGKRKGEKIRSLIKKRKKRSGV